VIKTGKREAPEGGVNENTGIRKMKWDEKRTSMLT
jgi:hypothetical protein